MQVISFYSCNNEIAAFSPRNFVSLRLRNFFGPSGRMLFDNIDLNRLQIETAFNILTCSSDVITALPLCIHILTLITNPICYQCSKCFSIFLFQSAPAHFNYLWTLRIIYLHMKMPRTWKMSKEDLMRSRNMCCAFPYTKSLTITGSRWPAKQKPSKSCPYLVLLWLHVLANDLKVRHATKFNFLQTLGNASRKFRRTQVKYEF